MRARTLFEDVRPTRRELLDFQAFLLDHLPDYVNIELSSNGVSLKGDFDQLDISFHDLGTSQARFYIKTVINDDYGEHVSSDWSPSAPGLSILRVILRDLNIVVGLRKVKQWLTAEGFEPESPEHPFRIDYSKVIADNIKVLVSFTKFLTDDHAFVQVGKNNSLFGQLSERHRFKLTTLKKLKQTVENAIDDYHSAYKDHATRLNLNAEQLRHLDEAKTHHDT